jgi:hypothetical protein
MKPVVSHERVNDFTSKIAAHSRTVCSTSQSSALATTS